MEELDIKELFQIFWTKKVPMIIIVSISIIVGYIYTMNYVTPKYKSSTTLILGRINASEATPKKTDDNGQITQSEISINSSLVSTYSELIKSKALIKEVKNNLNTTLSETDLRESVTVSRVSDTELIEITVTNIDSVLSSQVANEIAKVFGSKVEEIYNISNVYIIDEAVPATYPYNINHIKDMFIFTAIGLIISVAYAILYNLLDTTIKSSADIEKITNVKNLICIPFNKEEKTDLITFENSKSIVAETFRTLRTNVQFSSISDKKTKTYLITSCYKAEGKSYVAANLATTFAQAGKRVILIDSDMRRGRQAKVFNFSNDCGLSNYISNISPDGMEINYDITQIIKETNINNLNIITSGNVPPNPSELLASPKVVELIKALKTYYDVIIFDGAPVLPITDSLILTRLLDSTILVARYNQTKKDDLLKAKSDIENVGGKIIGTCLNGVSSKGNSSDLNYYYYYGLDEELTGKEKILRNLKNVKRAIRKLRNLNKTKNKNVKPRKIKEVYATRKPVVKDVKRQNNNVVDTVINDIGENQLKENEDREENLEAIKLEEEIRLEKLRIQEERRLEALRLEEQRIAEENARKLEEERLEQERKAEETRRLEEERLEQEKKAEEARRLEEERLEQERKAEEARRLEEERLEQERKAEEARKLEEERLEQERKAEEARKLEEERLEQERKAEEARKLEEERLEQERKAEEARKLEEERLEKERIKAEEAKKKEELKLQKQLERKQKREEKEQKRKEKINEMKNNIAKAAEERKIKKAEKRIKAMEVQAKQVKEKLEKAEEERNKIFGRRMMFDLDPDEGEDTSEKEENLDETKIK